MADLSKQIFAEVKPICVPLMKNALMSPTTSPKASTLLAELLEALRLVQNPRKVLEESLIQYIFFPISHILTRNQMSSIPDYVLEKVFQCTSILVDAWWWTMDAKTWQQLVLLTSSVLAKSMGKGKSKERDEATKEAAAQCLWNLIRSRETDIDLSGAEKRISIERHRTWTKMDVPFMSQALTSALSSCASTSLQLQLISLRITHVLISDFFGTEYMPTIMPGVISTVSQLVPFREGKAYQRGETAKLSLLVIQTAIVIGLDDDICAKEGAIRVANNLEDLADILVGEEGDPGGSPGTPSTSAAGEPVRRTTAWLEKSAFQVTNVLQKILPTMVSHPNPVALEGLLELCEAVLLASSLTLPAAQPILLSSVLILCRHDVQFIANQARSVLAKVVSPSSKQSYSILQTLLRMAKENLSSLSRLVGHGVEEKTRYAANIIISVCSMADPITFGNASVSISKNIAHLLGPNGGIERWGWGLLSQLELSLPSVTIVSNPMTLEAASDSSEEYRFPLLNLKHINSFETKEAITNLFRALGRAAGDDALFSVEWLVSFSEQEHNATGASALWCARHILEGVANETTSSTEMQSIAHSKSRRLLKHSRWLAKKLGSTWESEEDHATEDKRNFQPDITQNTVIEYVKGYHSLQGLLDLGKNAKPEYKNSIAEEQRVLHQIQILETLCVSALILRTMFSTLLLHCLYPILHAFVSENPTLAVSGMAALRHTADACGFASPANLLFANFDYALSSVSRHLTRQYLDMHAPRVLVVLVRLVGAGVVDRAGDIVEECFERLEDYHGYSVIVDGLLEVILEVTKVVEKESMTTDRNMPHQKDNATIPERRIKNPMDAFSEWFRAQKKQSIPSMDQREDFGPAPRHDWAELGTQTSEKIIEDTNQQNEDHEDDENPLSPPQKLVEQIVRRSLYFLTHSSPSIRARILTVLASSVSTLASAEAALVPSIHTAWPFILNRLKDSEPFVVVAAAELICALVQYLPEYVGNKIWEDVWPIFSKQLSSLQAADKASALARRGPNSIGTETTYATSHRLYSAMLKTLTLTVHMANLRDATVWCVLLACRRFLNENVHEELQELGRALYMAIGIKNSDAVWLALGGAGEEGPPFLRNDMLQKNRERVMEALEKD